MKYFSFLIAAAVLIGFPLLSRAQSTVFTYQGRLKDGTNPANGNYDFEFALFDAATNGTQVGSIIAKNNVAVVDGIFSVSLDFGAQFPGANRTIEIRVRLAGQSGITTLATRKLLSNTHYSLKSLTADSATTAQSADIAVNATNATNAATAANALQLGGVAANQYVLTGDVRLSDARPPTAGSANYIQNQTAGAQASNNFNISGNGIINGNIRRYYRLA